MEHSRKVALVPQHLLSSLLAQQQLNPAVQRLSYLDNGMQNMLENSNLPPDVKHKQYGQMMHRYQTLRDQELNKTFPIKLNEVPPTSTIPSGDIIDSLPRNYRNKAKLLLAHIRKTPNLQVDDFGQVAINGQPIEGSNITDLIFDYVKPTRRSQGPAGWRQFGKMLKQTNVPREAIVNVTRWNQIDEPVLAAAISSEDIEDLAGVSYKTPSEASGSSPLQVRRSATTSTDGDSPFVPRRGTRERKPTERYKPYVQNWRKFNQ